MQPQSALSVNSWINYARALVTMSCSVHMRRMLPMNPTCTLTSARTLACCRVLSFTLASAFLAGCSVNPFIMNYRGDRMTPVLEAQVVQDAPAEGTAARRAVIADVVAAVHHEVHRALVGHPLQPPRPDAEGHRGAEREGRLPGPAQAVARDDADAVARRRAPSRSGRRPRRLRGATPRVARGIVRDEVRLSDPAEAQAVDSKPDAAEEWKHQRGGQQRHRDPRFQAAAPRRDGDDNGEHTLDLKA